MRSVEKRINQQLNDIDAPVVTTDYKLPNYDPITEFADGGVDSHVRPHGLGYPKSVY